MDTGMDVLTLLNCRAWELFADECQLEYPGNFWKEYIHIFVPNRDKAKELWKLKREKLAHAASKWQRKLVRIFWSLNPSDKPIPIRPKTTCNSGDYSMESTVKIPDSVFGNSDFFKFTKPLLDTMGRILEADRPMAIVRLRDQKQLFLNQKFADMLATPPEIATGRSMKLGWNPAHLEECNRRIRQEGRFEITYDSALNPKTYGRQTAIIELIDDGVEQYRLNTNQGLELLDWPDYMKQLQHFDW